MNPFEALPIIENPDETLSTITLGYDDKLKLYKRIGEEGMINDELNLRLLTEEYDKIPYSKKVEYMNTYNELEAYRSGGTAANLIARRRESLLTPEERNGIELYTNILTRRRRINYTRGLLTILNDRPSANTLNGYTPYFKRLYDELNR